ncbi:hypothetical protein BOS5A_180122 [Bosea sp. EC-HK365B]|nr:hypothetical protein BOSE7B_60768 [Bosea sp. 7B]VVT57237.1 hypothetical protein BOS5A_180122 [Bosea sp. EC-HK365B]VXB51546.1 hypothetical protein BOSE127_120232 [Bosea sp. 127]
MANRASALVRTLSARSGLVFNLG